MLRRLALVVALLAAAGPAVAAPKQSCPMLTDPAGDVPPPIQSGTFDLVSADTSSTARDLTVVMRVAGLDLDAPEGRGGMYFRTGLDLPARGGGDAELQVDALVGADGTSFKGWVIADQTSNGPIENYGRSAVLTVDGWLDEDRSEIRFVVPLAEIGAVASVERGTPVTLTRTDTWYGVAYTGETLGVGNGSFSMEKADDATGHAVHRLGSPGCSDAPPTGGGR